MLDVSQPGELPLMKELIALKRARSLRDPSTASNWKSPVIGTPSSLNPSRRSPLRDSTGRPTESGRASGRGEYEHGQFTPNHARKASKRAQSSAVVSEFRRKGDGRRSWDLGIEGTVIEDVSEQEEVFGGLREDEASTHNKFQRKHTNNGRSEKALLQNWRNPSWVREIDGTDMGAAAIQTRDRIKKQTRSANGIIRVGGLSSKSDLHDLGNQAESRKIHLKIQAQNQRFLSKSSRKGCVFQQNAQILSPLVLNSADEIQYPAGQSMSLFTLESPYCNRRELLISRGRKTGQNGTRSATNLASKSQSPLSVGRVTSSGLRESVKSSWSRSQHVLSSSASTSQRTVSQNSVQGGWEVASNHLDDELDVSELPKNGCGIPCYWSKSQKRGKSLLDIAGRSFSCGFSDSSRKMGHSSSKWQHRELAGFSADESGRPLDVENVEALPLLTDPSAASDNFEGTSGDDSDRLSSDLNGELGLDCGSAKNKPKSVVSAGASKLKPLLTLSDGKELAIFVERPRSLSQKYRPKMFEELIGQNLVAHALSNAISKRKIAPVYLFQGPRGTGKTSAARIFAAALNCVTSEEQKPCGLCTECLALASGKSLDVREVDAASNNGIERVKALLQTAFSAPSFSRYRVFIVDECHMLTNETWNALLKLLEEPPGNVVFILITTDPEKLPRTAVSRCQRFPFPKIKEFEIVSRLQTLAKLENLDVEPGALDLIAARSDGSLRDAETILDQLSLLGQKITLPIVHELVGLVSDEKLLGLLDLALCSDTVSTVRRARELVDSGVDPLDLMSQLATLITDILAGSCELTNRDQEGGFFTRHTLSDEELERLRMALRILSEAEKQLRAASNDRTTWLTAALLQFGPDRPFMFPVSSSGTSVTASPITRSNSNDRLILESAALNAKKESIRKSMLKGMSSDSPRKVHASTVRGKIRPTRESFNVRIHPADQSCTASRVPSDQGSLIESPVSHRGNERHGSFLSPDNLRIIWCSVLEGCKSLPLRQLLLSHGKLLRASVSAVDAVVHLEFRNSEYKAGAERSKRSIATTFQTVLGVPVDVRISLASLPPGTEGLGSKLWSVMDQTANPGANTPRVDCPEESSHEVGSFHYCKNQNNLGQSSSPHNFSRLSTFLNGSVADPLKTAGSPRNVSFVGGGTWNHQAAELALPEEERLETAWIRQARRLSPLQGSECQNKNEALTQEIVVDDTKECKKPLHNLQTEQLLDENNIECPFPSCNGYKNPHVHDLEKENLMLEPRSKYGGLLCWRAPKTEEEKVTKQRPRRSCGIIIRLVPCANP